MKGLDFFVDKLTNSIERKDTGESFATSMALVSASQIKTVHKKDGWSFNWKKEFKEEGHQLYKLTLEGDSRIQGLISLESKPGDLYIEMHLIEAAPHNRDDGREFVGVAGNLVAFACKMSFELGFDGYVAFTAKTKLTDHYMESLGAQIIYGRERMAIFTDAARNLVSSYYPEFFNGR